ncbi:MAG: glycosyltransferase family 4 protein [Rubrobacter sp.]|nr:glycosyltransferase family 4 protein [Rubrobacter sp.]
MFKSNKQVHLISPMRRFDGGTTWRTLSLFEELKDFGKVSLWSEREPNPEILEKYPVKRMDPKRLRFPKTGTFVFVGVHSPVGSGSWIRYARPRRTVLIYNNQEPAKFHQRMQQLSNNGRRKVEVLYASELVKSSIGYPGSVQTSLIDIDRFSPPDRKPSDSGFIVGRLSRAVPKKHHPDDPALYRRLVDHDCSVRIMGATPPLMKELGGLESVTLLPALAQEAHLFLQGLDCFFYRTSEEWFEPSGRVITEAMACGLPIVCHGRGGYAEIIDHGRNGFLFDTQQEALEILLRLEEDRALRESIGKAARETAEEMFSTARRSEIVEFYLS